MSESFWSWRLHFSALLMISLASPLAAQTNLDAARDTADVLDAARSFLAAFNDLDWEPFHSSFSPSATVFQPFGDPWRNEDQEELSAFFQAFFNRVRSVTEGPPYLEIVPEDLRIERIGDAAVVTFHLPGPETVGRRTLVFGRSAPGEAWRIVHLHASVQDRPSESVPPNPSESVPPNPSDLVSENRSDPVSPNRSDPVDVAPPAGGEDRYTASGMPDSPPPRPETAHPSPHRILEIQVEPEVALEVLDWGGEGEALVFLAGASHNAHIFDAFAPRFSDGYRLLGITRRGHGASSWPESGYELPRLVEDIRVVLDGLRVEKVILAGHSLAGSEMTAFTSEHPDRVSGLIYIDAAHDHANAPVQACSFDEASDEGAPRAALESVQDHAREAFGFLVPEWVIRTQFRIGDDGRVLGSSTAPGMFEPLFSNLPPPDYAGVQAPALGIYYVPERIDDIFPDSMETTAECRSAAQRYIYDGIASFAAGLDRATVVAVQDSQHNMVLMSPEAVEAAMRSWFAGIER